jgi:hypothetical protein
MRAVFCNVLCAQTVIAEAQPNILHIQSVGINFYSEEASGTFA